MISSIELGLVRYIQQDKFPSQLSRIRILSSKFCYACSA